MSDERAGSGVDHERSTAADARDATGAAGGIMCGDAGCVHLSPEAAQAIWRAVKQQQAERNVRYPDEPSAIRAMCDGWVRLKDMGWRDAMYAPKHEPIELIEVGSSGIHSGFRDEQGFWINADGDTWPSSPCLWRPEARELVVDRSRSIPDALTPTEAPHA